jgi:hypothetical protein
VTFVGIDTETDYIALGKVRDLWQRDAVEKHRAEWNGQKLGQSNSGSKPVEMP